MTSRKLIQLILYGGTCALVAIFVHHFIFAAPVKHKSVGKVQNESKVSDDRLKSLPDIGRFSLKELARFVGQPIESIGGCEFWLQDRNGYVFFDDKTDTWNIMKLNGVLYRLQDSLKPFDYRVIKKQLDYGNLKVEIRVTKIKDEGYEFEEGAADLILHFKGKTKSIRNLKYSNGC